MFTRRPRQSKYPFCVPPTKSLVNTVGSHGVCSTDGCQSTSAKQNFSEALLGLAKFVLFGTAWALAIRVLLWPVSLGRVSPLLFFFWFLFVLFYLVVFYCLLFFLTIVN